MKEILNKKFFNKQVVQVFIMSIAVASWLIGGLITNKIRNDAQEELVVQVSSEVKNALSDIEDTKVSSNYPDYSSLEDLNKLEIISNFESWTPNAIKNSNKVNTTIVLDKGKLSQGYLYIKASVENKPMSRWESVFVQMNYKGGHLLRNKSIPVPSSNKTELLYALDDISYITNIPYKENDNYNKTNWLNQFYPNGEIRIDAFISSLRPAILEEMSIYYVCDDGQDCSLSLK